MLVYLNGKFIERRKAVISIDDHGFLYGDGVYETIRVYHGAPFHLQAHLSRLRISARGLGIRLPLSDGGFRRIIASLIHRNRLTEAVVRITLTRGPGPRGLNPVPCKTPTLLIACYPFRPYPTSWRKKGIRVALSSLRRNSPLSMPPWIKSNNCLNGVLAMQEAHALKAQEAIFLSLDGHLTEGTVSNLFIVKKGVLMTPRLDRHFLAGVTRRFVLSLAKKQRRKVKEKILVLKDITSADEIFVTNTTMEVMPVRSVVVKRGGRSVRLFSSKTFAVATQLQADFTARSKMGRNMVK